MKKIYVFLLMPFLLVTCKKKKDDCETKNFGSLKVAFGAFTKRHSIIITYPGAANAREKIVPIGATSDTVQIPPDVYPITISSLNSSGQVVDQSVKSTTIAKCQQSDLSVPF